MEDRATLPAGAPGNWSRVQEPAGVGAAGEVVRVRFTQGADAALLWTQLELWNDALKSNPSEAIVHASLERGTDDPEFTFPAPASVGIALPTPHLPADVLTCVRAVAVALDDLHAHGLVHSALVPASVWWMPDRTVRFPDAGLAHALEGVLPPTVNVHMYRAPEVWHGNRPVPASDQYSLAVMAYEMFTGRRRDDLQMVEGIVAVEPVTLDANVLAGAGAPVAIADVLQRALSSSPRSRFESCTAFADALAAHIAAPRTANASPRRLARRRPRQTIAAVLTVFVATMLIVVAVATMRDRDGVRRSFANLRSRLPLLATRSTIASAPPNAAPVAQMHRERVNTVAPVPGRTSSTAAATTPPTSRAAAVTATPASAAAPVGGGQRGTTTIGQSAPVSSDTIAGRLATGLASARGGVDRAVSGVVAKVPTVGRPAIRSGESGGRLDALPFPGDTGIMRRTSAVVPAASGVAGAAGSAGAPVSSDNSVSPATRSAATGTLRLVTPAGSRVYLDGVLLGVSNGPVPVSAGQHDLDVLLSGGGSRRRRVQVRQGEITDVRIAR